MTQSIHALRMMMLAIIFEFKDPCELSVLDRTNCMCTKRYPHLLHAHNSKGVQCIYMSRLDQYITYFIAESLLVANCLIIGRGPLFVLFHDWHHFIGNNQSAWSETGLILRGPACSII